MKKYFLLIQLVLLSFEVEAAIKPSSKSPLYSDLYFSYQWALENAGQRVIGDIDDITPFETVGMSWASIDWSIELDSLFKKDTVVAVIDSGVDIDHEDLKGRILLNDKECRDGRIPLGATGDPDGNGFEGDCAGWNFSTNDVRRKRFVEDDVGHGTHVAGIIAANTNNGIGLAGLSNRIKILPLKVFDSREGKMPPGSQDVISIRVAKAINYAIERKVDVINLSLGWPILANNLEVKQAIERAETEGIAVVAAAGNDRHEAQIYPCAYKSVFCVGSINVDGEVSRFSNFGGHVDILAPGGQILGLIPMTISSDFFGMKGYDIKFGTSQASPYVAGAIAILKAIYPQATNDDIRSALMSTARKVPALASGLSVFSSSGLVQITKAHEFLKKKNALTPRPIFKEFSHLVLKEKTLEGEFFIPFVHGVNLLDHERELTSFNDDITLKGEWRPEGVKLSVKAHNEWASAHLKFSIRLKDQTYTHQILLVKEIDENKKEYVATAGLLKNLKTVITPFKVGAAPRFYQFIKEEKRLEVYALEEGMVKRKVNLVIPEIDQVLDGIGVQRVDIDRDGDLDYWVTSVVLDTQGRAKEIRYLFFDDEGVLLNQSLHEKGKMSLKFSSEYSLPVPAITRFIDLDHPEFGKIHTAVFLTKAHLEPIDQSKDAFDPNPGLMGVHLNYLMPEREGEEIIWRARSLTKSSFQKKMRSVLGLPSWAKFELLHLRFSDETNSSEVSVLLRTGSGILQDYYHLNLSGDEFLAGTLSHLNFTSFQTFEDLGNQVFESAFSINSDGDFSMRTSLRGQFSKDRMRSLLLGSEGVLENFSYRTQDPREFIASLIKEYYWEDKTVRFFELDTTLEVIMSSKDEDKVFSAPIYRTSFVQGSTFSLRFTPMTEFNQWGELASTLYVDNSALFSPTIYMWQVTDEKVYVPLKFSFEVNSGCQAMNPTMIEKESYAVLFCKGQNDAEFVELVAF